MPVDAHVRALLDREPGDVRVAIVGASNDPRKFGHKILLNLARKGFDVVPIHPTEAAVAGRTAYPTVQAAPGPIHIVDFVVPPDVTRAILEGLDADAFEVVWLQPGSFDRAAAQAAERFAHPVVGDCIMVEA
ncbi:MAG: CoA-binding protein [Deltaproteobacteria bacterium]